MENKEKKLEKNEIETIMEMSEEELNEVVGGRDVYCVTYKQDPEEWDYLDRKYSAHFEKKVNPPKWPCPKCGSKNVSNYNPGFLLQMRVFCKDCGFLGCRDGSNPFGWHD